MTEPHIIRPKDILRKAQTTLAVTQVADRISREIDPGGTPFAKMRLGYVTAFDPATWTCTALIGDLLTSVPNVAVLGHVLPAVESAGLFAQTGGKSTTEYTLVGMLPKDQGTPTYGQVWRVRKTADQSVTNSASAISDNDLKFYGQAGRAYIVEIYVIVTKTGSETVSDLKLGWVLPSGARWYGGGPGPISSMAASTNTQETTGAGANWRAAVNATGTLSYGVEAEPGGGTSLASIAMFHGTIKMSGTSGVCTVVWAQQIAGGGGITTTVKEGSYLKSDMTTEYLL